MPLACTHFLRALCKLVPAPVSPASCTVQLEAAACSCANLAETLLAPRVVRAAPPTAAAAAAGIPPLSLLLLPPFAAPAAGSFFVHHWDMSGWRLLLRLLPRTSWRAQMPLVPDKIHPCVVHWVHVARYYCCLVLQHVMQTCVDWFCELWGEAGGHQSCL
jgi:hypothetical protein